MNQNLLIPTVIEQSPKGDRAFDLYSRLLRDRTVFLTGQVSEELAQIVVAQLLFLRAENSNAPITIWISGPGGSVSAGFTIRSAVNLLKASGMTIITIQVGFAASMSSLLAASLGSPGQRYILEDAETLIHEVRRGQRDGQVTTYTDSEEQFNDLKRTNTRLVDIYMERAKVSRERLETEMKRDKVLTTEQTVEYGFADAIIRSFEDIK